MHNGVIKRNSFLQARVPSAVSQLRMRRKIILDYESDLPHPTPSTSDNWAILINPLAFNAERICVRESFEIFLYLIEEHLNYINANLLT